METLKPDAKAILTHLENIKQQPWLTESQRWWPDHLFHFTDILNAIKILNDGMLLSRSKLKEKGELITDIASQEVVESTASKWKDFVRLYFRPRTPMQYRNEGFRPKDQRELGSHCPVPIIFIFDAKSILTNQSYRFRGDFQAFIFQLFKKYGFITNYFCEIMHELCRLELSSPNTTTTLRTGGHCQDPSGYLWT